MVFGEKDKMNKKKKKTYASSLFFLAFFLVGVSSAFASEVGRKIESVQVVSGWDKIKIIWEKNEYLSETQSVVLVRQKDNCPKDLSDGEEIYRGNGFQFEDNNVSRGEKYCYGVGILELSGGSSGFSSSRLVGSVGFRERILLMFESKLNLMMFFEALILICLIFLVNWKRKRISNAKAKLILRKL
jgi:hypothetical protein